MNEEIKDAARLRHIQDSFHRSLAQTMTMFPGKEEQNKILGFILQISSQYLMQIAFTTEGIGKLVTLVMENEFNRAFVFRLVSSFRTRYGANQDDWKFLVENLATSLDVVGGDLTNSTIPQILQERLPEQQLIQQTLNGNPWMVVVVMISLYVETDLTSAANAAAQGR